MNHVSIALDTVVSLRRYSMEYFLVLVKYACIDGKSFPVAKKNNNISEA
jgi:hypothetical protein